MSNQRQPASALLPVLAEAFPHTFFADPKQVRPLKINIHRDLNALRKAQALPAEITLIPLRRFLHGYTQWTAYLKALARGEGRLDLTGEVVDSDIPEPIRELARQEIARRQPQKIGTTDTRKAAPAHRAAVALLSRLAAAFPQTFFADPKQVRPLKAFLYRDLLRLAKAGALPEGIDRAALKAFLRWYGRRTAYLNALARGKSRIDLTGAVVTTPIPDALRQQARAEVQRRQANRAAQAATPAAASSPPAPAPDSMPYTLEDLYAMAVDAKLEVTLKFSTLPNAKPAGAGKMAFALKTPDGQYVTAEVGNKVWAKLMKAAEEWPAWIAALSGTMGPRTEKGFVLANPGLQVFERKPKAPVEAASPLADALSAALAAVSPVETAPAPAVADPAESVSVPLAAATAESDSASRKPVLSLRNRKATP